MRTRDALRLCAEKLDYLEWCCDDMLNGGLHQIEDFRLELAAMRRFLMDIGWEMPSEIETAAELPKELQS